LSAVPTIVSDLKRIDTAWTGLQQQIDRDCGLVTTAVLFPAGVAERPTEPVLQ
jgi:hypothetical protein